MVNIRRYPTRILLAAILAPVCLARTAWPLPGPLHLKLQGLNSANTVKYVQLNRPSVSQTMEVGGWRLVRTPGPEKEGDTVSIIRTAELLNSDADFAGIMIRCQDKSAPQIGFIMVTPFKPGTKADISVAVGYATVSFGGTVIGPGTMVALPLEASHLLPSWQSAKSLKVTIAGDETRISGVVPLGGLREALAQLDANCIR